MLARKQILLKTQVLFWIFSRKEAEQGAKVKEPKKKRRQGAKKMARVLSAKRRAGSRLLGKAGRLNEEGAGGVKHEHEEQHEERAGDPHARERDHVSKSGGERGFGHGPGEVMVFDRSVRAPFVERGAQAFEAGEELWPFAAPVDEQGEAEECGGGEEVVGFAHGGLRVRGCRTFLGTLYTLHVTRRVRCKV